MRLICNIPPRLMDGFHDKKLPIAYAENDEGVEIFMHGIVGDQMTATDSMSVGQILSRNKQKPVTLRVNSPGGLAYDGVAIYNAIWSHDGPTTGIIEGLAGSAASLAVVACDSVHCYDGAVFHPHYSLVLAFGHQPEIRDALLVQERLDKDLEKMYAKVSGQSLEKVQQDLFGPNGDGTPFSAEEAQAAGYVDHVIEHGRKGETAAAAQLALTVGERQRVDMRRRVLAARTKQMEVRRCPT